MNYYERHLGDYAKDTGHLSILEHGVYTLLLDRYYSTESGIPAAQANRLARARSTEECQAVDAVLEEFFTLVDGVWINRRADEEIAAARVRITAAQENGKKGGRPPKKPGGIDSETQEKPTGFSLGSENETQQKAHQAPSTKHQLKTISPAESVNNSTGVTPAGLVCARLKSECGISSGLNPQHPKLLALLAAGMTADELVSAGMDANGKGFAWVMAAAEGRRRDAEKVAGLPEARARASPSRQINGRQAAIDNYAAQAAAARGEHGKPERDITGESVRVA